jgi:type I restriction enzyme S subunit
MKPQRLLEAFNRLGDEPETVQQFRKLVIGLAMSGKLVASDDEVIESSGLLKQIETKKLSLINEGVLRKQNPLAALVQEDLPRGFNDPASFVRLGSIARIEKGLTGIIKAKPGRYPLVVTAEDRASCDHFDFDGAAAIVPLVSSAGHGKASLHRLHYQEGKFALGSILAAIFPYASELISARFLFEYLTAFKDELLVSQMIGTANVSLSVGKVSGVPVPLVSPSVQRKVDRLMVLCDRIEAARKSGEAARDRLAAASLARLNAPDSETFHADAHFALDILPALTTRPDQMSQLRQTILNLAVRGKLVAQDAADEPASGLLERINNQRLQKSRSSEVEDPNANLKSPSFRFFLPHNWQEVSLGALAIFENGDRSSNYPSGPDIKTGGIPFFSTKNLSNFRLQFSNLEFITEEKFKSLRSGKLQDQDILITLRGSVGKFGLFEANDQIKTGFINAQLLIVRSVEPAVVQYLTMFMRSDAFADQLSILSSGSTTPQLSAGQLSKAVLPLPPHRCQGRCTDGALRPAGGEPLRHRRHPSPPAPRTTGRSVGAGR